MNKPLSKAATTAQHEIELVRKRHEQRQREMQGQADERPGHTGGRTGGG